MLVLISFLVAVAAFFGWISSRVLKIPNTIGTMLLTAATSLSLVLLARVWPEPHDWALRIIGQVDFERLILHGMLSLLLFAGASLVDLDALRQQKLAVGFLATLTTIVSIGGVGIATYYAALVLGFHASFMEALLFGAIISPTDPIAVLEMLRRVQTPKFLEAQLAGESLFNDGVGAVFVLGLLGAMHGGHPSLPGLSLKILIASGGGMALGILLAFPIAFLMRNVQSVAVDILLSLAPICGDCVPRSGLFCPPQPTLPSSRCSLIVGSRWHLCHYPFSVASSLGLRSLDSLWMPSRLQFYPDLESTKHRPKSCERKLTKVMFAAAIRSRHSSGCRPCAV